MLSIMATEAGAAAAGAQEAAASASGSRAASAAPLGIRLSMDSVYDAVGPHAGAGAAEGGAQLRAEIVHQRSSRRATLRLWGGVTATQGWAGVVTGSTSEAVDVSSTVTLTRRMRLELGGRVSYTPLDLFPAFGATDGTTPGRPVISGSEVPGQRTMAQDARVTLVRALGSRSSATFVVTQSTSQREGDRSGTLAAGGRISRRIGPFVAWHGGYGYTTGAFLIGASSIGHQRHDLDIGIDYARPLPFWEHTTFSVSTGTALLVDPISRHLRVNTAAAMEHRVSQSWSGRLDYSRPIQFVAGFTKPFLSDAVRIAATGRLSARATVTAIAGIATGTVGANAGAARFASRAASLRVARRVSAFWEAEAEFHDARYRMDGATPGIPSRFTRRGVRAGLVWAPRLTR
jgi:hypothetical protein